MKTADILLTNAHVLTMDENDAMYDPGAVAIQGDKHPGGRSGRLNCAGQFQAKETLDCGGKVLMPGLVNAHTHVPMTLLRGLADDLRLDVWLLGYMMPVEREFVSPDFVTPGDQDCLRGTDPLRRSLASPTCTISKRTSPAPRPKPGCGRCAPKLCLKFPAPTRHHTKNRWPRRASSSRGGSLTR